jgi:methionine sulfoxide reductase heme-binding subunit
VKDTSLVWPRVVGHIAGLAPLALILVALWRGELSADPIRDLQLRTGKIALVLLVMSLSCTPAVIISGFRPILQLRRPLGLYAVGYASLHVLNLVGLDYGFNLPLLWRDALDKRFALAGLVAFLGLLPLAATSTPWWRTRLGGRWRNLHRLVYGAVVFDIGHYVWLTKADYRQPLMYAIAVATLLALRTPPVVRAFGGLRSRLGGDITT